MNYNYLRYFSVLAQLEHYTLAAARLGISQPSLSSAIHHLEAELGGIQLFEKVGRNIRLTEEGRYFQEKVDSALQELQTASATLRDSKAGAPMIIRLGVISGMLGGVVAREISDYLRQNSRIRFHITESSAEDLMDLVRQEKLDMAIVDCTNRDRSLHFRKLYQQNFYAALPLGSPLADRETILPQEISAEPQIFFNNGIENSFGQWASGDATAPHSVCTVNTVQSALELVAAGVGTALISESCFPQREDIRCVPVTNWHQALYMCILYDKWLEPPVWAFVERLVAVLRSTQQETVPLK